MQQERTHGAFHWIKLGLFVLLVFGGGILIGLSTPIGDWYDGLSKPFFNPPGWLFGPVWSLLYLMIAVAGWRTWNRNPAGLVMQVWFGQLALNFIWMPVFFGMHAIFLGLVIIVALLAAIVWYIRLTWNWDRPGALLFIPYLAWVCFATLLNLSIWWLN